MGDRLDRSSAITSFPRCYYHRTLISRRRWFGFLGPGYSLFPFAEEWHGSRRDVACERGNASCVVLCGWMGGCLRRLSNLGGLIVSGFFGCFKDLSVFSYLFQYVGTDFERITVYPKNCSVRGVVVA